MRGRRPPRPGRTALLMANHGSITGGASLTKALDAAEELEATAAST